MHQKNIFNASKIYFLCINERNTRIIAVKGLLPLQLNQMGQEMIILYNQSPIPFYSYFLIPINYLYSYATRPVAFHTP